MHRALLVAASLALAAFPTAGCGVLHQLRPEPFVLSEDYLTLEQTWHPFDDADQLPADRGLLIAPHLALRISQLDVTSDPVSGQVGWGPAEAGDQPRVAADGYELIIAELAVDEERTPWRGQFGELNTDAVSLAIDVDGHESELAQLLSYGSYVLVVSVPVAGEGWLRITDADRTHSISLRDGSLGDDVHEGFYQPTRLAIPDAAYAETGVVTTVGRFRELTVEVKIGQAQLTPWTPAAGWAGDGESWLLLNQITLASDNLLHDASADDLLPISFDLDLGRTLQLQLPDGTEVTPTGAPVVSLEADTFMDYHQVAFKVPTNFHAGTITVSPAGEMTGRFRDGSPEAAWVTPPEPREYPITAS